MRVFSSGLAVLLVVGLAAGSWVRMAGKPAVQEPSPDHAKLQGEWLLLQKPESPEMSHWRMSLRIRFEGGRCVLEISGFCSSQQHVGTFKVGPANTIHLIWSEGESSVGRGNLGHPAALWVYWFEGDTLMLAQMDDAFSVTIRPMVRAQPNE